MKKQLLLGIALCIAGAGFAQNSAPFKKGLVPQKINPTLANKAVLYQENNQLGGSQDSFENCVYNLNHNIKPNVQVQNRAFTSEIIGSTFYQMQTNASICNRIVNSPDGTVSATWTMAQVENTWTDRGTGYNYFDGISWGAVPLTKVENVRTGFPNIGITSSGAELIISHDGTQLHNSSRPVKGTGTWNDASLSGIADVWSRMCVGGANGESVHIISRGGSSANANGPLTYSRSLDGGASWDKEATIIPQIDASSYLGFGGDQYAIDAKGDVIAIAIGGFDVDVILLKSIDNGNSWTKTIVYQFPIPFYDGATMNTLDSLGIVDTLETNDASVAVLLDNQGKAHVWYGRMMVSEDAGGTGLSYFPGTDGLMYWNENMGDVPKLIAAAADLNNDNLLNIAGFGSYQVSMTSFPSAGIDAQGNIFLSYSSIFEGIDDGGTGNIDGSTGAAASKSYRHTYITCTPDGGITWCNPKDITNPASPIEDGTYDYLESVFGAMAKDVDGSIHLIVEQDGSTGHGVSSTTTVDPQAPGMAADIVYYKIPVADVICPSTVGINQNKVNKPTVSLYPNPATTNAILTFTNSSTENVTVTIYTVTGQLISELTNKVYVAGSHNLNVNLTDYNSGIYFYTVKVGSNLVNGKLIIQK